MLIIESAGLTDVGKKRKGNEDSFFVDDRMQLYIVSDGMGGHKAGEVASRLVVETLHDYLKRFEVSDQVEELQDSDPSLSRPANRLLSGIHLANKVVHQIAQGNAAYEGMGATVSAVCFNQANLIVANVGDSPVYLARGAGITLQSKLHTFMAEQEAIAPEGARKLGERFRHMLTRAVGTKPAVQPSVIELPCHAGDSIVISSDGLTDKVKPEEIRHVVSRAKPEKACRVLVELANKRGGDDNITVIVIQVKQMAVGPSAAAVPATPIVVDFDTDEHSYRGTVRQWAADRVVIQTAEPLAADLDIMMNFVRTDGAGSLAASGRITGRNGDEVTVSFDPPLSAAQKKTLADLAR